jgi:hypothetical protein
MKWAILTSGPYMEMMHFMWTPTFDESTSTNVFYIPLGQGTLPMIHLDDLGEYARWIFDHPDQSAGMDLGISTQHVHGEEIARAFTSVTGQKAVYQDISTETWFDSYMKEDVSSAYQVTAGEPGVLSWRSSFTGFWNLWRECGGEEPLVTRDYDQLDKVRHPSPLQAMWHWD